MVKIEILISEGKAARLAQYYAGTTFSKETYANRALEFLKTVVAPYLEKINILLEEK